MSAGLPRNYTLRPSRIFIWFLFASGLLLLTVLSQLVWESAWVIVCDVLVVAALVFVAMRDARLMMAQSFVLFRLESKNEITLVQRNGRRLTGTISSGGVVTPMLVLLDINVDEYGRRSLVLAPDSMGREEFRRLRVALTWNH
jgi:hypothetical protein